MPGTVTFRPLSAKLTRNTELFGTMDPYCKIVMGKQKVQSAVCENGGKDPHWESSFMVLKRTNEPFCEMEIKEKDWLLPDGTIGTCKINLGEVEQDRRVLKWYPVLFKEKPAGKILLEISYEPEGGAARQPSVPEPQVVQILPQQFQNAPVQPMNPNMPPVQHDYRQPVHNQGQQFPGGHIHGFNPINPAPQHSYNQPSFNQPAPVHHEPESIYAPRADVNPQGVTYTQKYPTFDSERVYGPEDTYNNGNQNNYPYSHDSRPVTDFPHPGADHREDRPFSGIDIIRGTR